MPYPVLPPPPPPLVETQPPTDSAAEPAEFFFNTSDAADAPNPARPSSLMVTTPAAVAPPDTFPPEYAPQSLLKPQTESSSLGVEHTEASMLGGEIGIGVTADEHEWSPRPGAPLIPQPLSTVPPQATPEVGGNELPIYTTRQLSLLDPETGDRMDAIPQERLVQLESDMQEISGELLLPLKDMFLELYQLAEETPPPASGSTPERTATPFDAETLDAQGPTSSPAPVPTSDDGLVPIPVNEPDGAGLEDPTGSESQIQENGPGLSPTVPRSPSSGSSPNRVEDPFMEIPEPDLEEGSEPGSDQPEAPPDAAPTDEVLPDEAPGDGLDEEGPVELSPEEPLPDAGPVDEIPSDGSPANGILTPEAEPPATPGQAPTTGTGTGDAIEVTADRQIYDTNQRVFIAEGNVELLFRGSVLNADRVSVNLPNNIAVAQGNVVFTRGEQVLRGDRIEYNIVREEGAVTAARGEIFLPGVNSDLDVARTDDGRTEAPPLSQQLEAGQPTVETAVSTGGIRIGLGSSQGGGIQGGSATGEVRQLRFEADQIDFTPTGWVATNVRITNDPFSPPELELRTNRATFRRLSPTRSELIANNPRLVFDQGFSLPLLRERFIFDENRRNQALFQFGYDEEDRGGFYIERTFQPLVTPFATLTIRPQIYVQRALGGDPEDDDGDDDNSGFTDLDAYGLIAQLDVNIDQRTGLTGQLEMTSLELEDFDEEARGSVRLQRGVLPIRQGGRQIPDYHVVTAEYSYRDRLFNGSLGFQTVQRTYGVILTSPTIRFGVDERSQGFELTYQAAIQRVNANITADRRDDLLPPPPRDNVRASLTRYQVAATLRRPYTIWQGEALPATPEEGLRYSPVPIVPYLSITPSVRGVASFYSSGDEQPVLTGEVTLAGQFGHFSRPYLDYFGFSLSYRRSTEGSESPFDFDRLRDREVVSAAATAQIYGPFRFGIRTSISLDEDEEFDNSFFLEYSRRTYGITLSYNPDREIGALTFRLSDFNWTGVPEPFGGTGVREVESGVVPVEPEPEND